MRDQREPSWLPDLVARLHARPLCEDDFLRLVDLYEGRLQGFFRALGADRETARDYTQETFLRVFKSIRGFRTSSTFTYWLFCIAKNVWKNDLRREGAAKRTSPERISAEPPDDRRPAPPPPPPWQTASPPVEELLAATDDRRRLASAVAQLPERMRKVVVLRFGHDLKYREIAERLDIRIDTVKSQLHYALERLRPLLRHEGREPEP